MDSYAMAITRETARLHQDGVGPHVIEQYAKGSVLYARLVSIEEKLNKLISMQDWNEMADEAERKDGEDGG